MYNRNVKSTERKERDRNKFIHVHVLCMAVCALYVYGRLTILHHWAFSFEDCRVSCLVLHFSLQLQLQLTSHCSLFTTRFYSLLANSLQKISQLEQIPHKLLTVETSINSRLEKKGVRRMRMK